LIYDLRTFAIAVSISSAVFFFSAWFLLRIFPEEKSLRDWVMGALAATVGSSLSAMRGLIPDFFVVVLGNTTNLVALSLILLAIRGLLRLQTPRKWLPIVASIFAITATYFTLVDPNVTVRVAILSLLAGGLYANIAWACFRHGGSLPRPLTLVTGALSAVGAGASFTRAFNSPRIAAEADFITTSDLTLAAPYLFTLTSSNWLAIMLSLVIGFRIQQRLESERNTVQAMNKDLRILSTTDGLSGLVNRRHCDVLLYAAVAATHARNGSLSVALIDLDHFKKVNDTHGHQAGDAVLRKAAQAITSAVRSQDTIGRWGGEEFLAILPGAGGAESLAIGERIRAAIAECEQSADSRVTASVGVASLRPSDTAESLVRRADDALYAAKKSGRDQVRGNSSDLGQP
jgi:diguanylate cyclase (GGDEF)-like protein